MFHDWWIRGRAECYSHLSIGLSGGIEESSIGNSWAQRIGGSMPDESAFQARDRSFYTAKWADSCSWELRNSERSTWRRRSRGLQRRSWEKETEANKEETDQTLPQLNWQWNSLGSLWSPTSCLGKIWLPSQLTPLGSLNQDVWTTCQIQKERSNQAWAYQTRWLLKYHFGLDWHRHCTHWWWYLGRDTLTDALTWRKVLWCLPDEVDSATPWGSTLET